MEVRKVALSLIETVECATILKEFLKRYEPSQPVCLSEKEKQALLSLLSQLIEDSSDYEN